MDTVFVWNAYNKIIQQYNDWDQIDCFKIILKINKTLYVLSCLFYNCEISKLLTANIFLGLSKYYTYEKALKKVNIKVFQLYFPKTIFQNAEKEKITENFILFCILTIMQTFIFYDYFY